MKTDNLFYRIFNTLPALALELAGVTVANPAGYGFRAEEVKQTAFRLDGLLIPPADDPVAPLIFLEAQAQPDDDFYGRFFSEIFLYLYRSVPRPCWRALVLYTRHAIERLDPCYASLLTLPEVRRVYLDDLINIADPSLGLQLLQLLVAAPRAAAEQARRLARQLQTGDEPGDLFDSQADGVDVPGGDTKHGPRLADSRPQKTPDTEVGGQVCLSRRRREGMTSEGEGAAAAASVF